MGEWWPRTLIRAFAASDGPRGGAPPPNGDVWLAEDGDGLLVAVTEDGQKVESWRTRNGAPLVDLVAPCSIIFGAEGHAFVIECEMRTMAVFDAAHEPIGAMVAPEELPFGASHAFGPDGRLNALTGGRRWAGTAVDEPDDIVVMEVDLPAPA